MRPGAWLYRTCRDRDAALLPTVATKLLEAAGFAALALAVTDEPSIWPHATRFT
jgi:hypothetical protein